MPDIRLAPNFTLAEFERASQRPLGIGEKARAQRWATLILQPARDELGRIRITSYVRTGAAVGAGPHADGSAVDVQPLDASVETLFRWYVERRGLFGELIQERDHVHLTLPGTAGDYGQVLRETREGTFVPATAPAVVGLVLLVALLVLVLST